jgi:beta-lactamase regulating signal transducer with metallopeptidase domain
MSGAIDLVLRSAIVLTLAWIAVLLLRRRAASVRALVWTAGLAGTLALPLLTQTMPTWTIAVWQEPAAEAHAPREAPAPAAAPAYAAMPAALPVEDRIQRERSADPIIEIEAAVTPVPQSAARTNIDWTSVAWVVWSLFTSLLLARIVASHRRMNVLLEESGPADPAWNKLIEELTATRRIRRAVNVRMTEAVSVPAIVGVLRPTLLLPADADEWDEETRRAVVLHELAHVARWDALAQLVGQIACAVYWFIPLTWYGARRASALREHASDDEVLLAGVRASAYAERLLHLAKGAGSADMQLAALAMARPSRMRERVVAILDPSARRSAVTRRAVAITLLLSTSAITAVAAAAPTTLPSEPVIIADADVSVGEPSLPRRTEMAQPQAAARQSQIATQVSAQPTADAPVATSIPAPPAAVVIAEQVRETGSTLRMCDGETSNHSSGDRNGRPMLTLKVSGSGCRIELSSEGRITFTDDFSDIAAIDRNGFFRLDVTDAGTRRQLDIESRNGTLERTWRVNGREQPYDDAAHAWFASFLIALDRRSAFGVDVRLPYLLRQGGVDAVLRETALMTNDYARTAYHTRLAKTRLSAADSARVLDQAAAMTKSDHYATELLKTFGNHGGLGAPAQRAAIARMIESMDSDHYRAESIEALVASGPPSADEMDFLLRMVPRMKSDHYKVQTLSKVVDRGTLTAAQQAQLARAALDIENDHYATEFLRKIAGTGPMASEVRLAYLEAVARIEGDHYGSEALRVLIRRGSPAPADVAAILRLAPGLQSDHYRTEVLAALLEASGLTESDLLGVVAAARSMSDHYESETLRKVVLHRAFTARVRDAVISAAEAMSQHYGDEVRRAAVRVR